MKKYSIPVQSLIDHIKTARDVDPWAKGMAAELLARDKPVSAEIEGGGSTWFYECGECHGSIARNDTFCRHCGCVISWSEK